MKLRIRDNSVRLRLMRAEVELVAADGRVRGSTQFAGGHAFAYVLESSAAITRPDADISDDVLTVRIPAAELGEWAGSEQVSIASEQDLGDGNVLTILVEKDFACLSPREGEDESDMFRHPDEHS